VDDLKRAETTPSIERAASEQEIQSRFTALPYPAVSAESVGDPGCPMNEAVPALPASVLRDEPLHRLFKSVGMAFRQRLTRQMQLEGFGDLLPSATVLLLHIGEDDGQTLSELAQKCGLENSTLTPLIDALERKHLLHRVRSPQDRRVIHLHLTRKGQELEPRIRALWRSVQDAALTGITDNELAAMHRIMGRIADNLHEQPSDSGV